MYVHIYIDFQKNIRTFYKVNYLLLLHKAKKLGFSNPFVFLQNSFYKRGVSMKKHVIIHIHEVSFEISNESNLGSYGVYSYLV